MVEQDNLAREKRRMLDEQVENFLDVIAEQQAKIVGQFCMSSYSKVITNLEVHNRSGYTVFLLHTSHL